MNLSGILLGGMVGLFVLALGFVLIFMIYQRRMIAKDLLQQRRENDYQRNLLRAVIESQEAERKRIAHDLHDEVGALLSTSRLYFNQLQPGHAEEQLTIVGDKVNLLFTEMMGNIRRISHDLRPVVLENLGLKEAIESIRQKVCDAGIQFELTYSLSVIIQKEFELHLFRIVQELISNTVNHAGADAISLRLEEYDRRIVLSYSDNGIGFPTKKATGLGLKSIESRLSLMKATMEITHPEKGVCFLVMIPLDIPIEYEKH
jgi:signal transduction histidine kinase